MGVAMRALTVEEARQVFGGFDSSTGESGDGHWLMPPPDFYFYTAPLNSTTMLGIRNWQSQHDTPGLGANDAGCTGMLSPGEGWIALGTGAPAALATLHRQRGLVRFLATVWPPAAGMFAAGVTVSSVVTAYIGAMGAKKAACELDSWVNQGPKVS
jgi:hypothetical protein